MDYEPLAQPNPYDALPFPNYYGAEALQQQEIDTATNGAAFNLYFLPHTSKPIACRTVAGAVSALDPTRSFVTVEGFGQPASSNDPTYRDGRPDTPHIAAQRAHIREQAKAAVTAARGGEEPGFNCIGLGRRVAQACHVPFAVADFTDEDITLWQAAQREEAAGLPDQRAAAGAFFANTVPDLDFQTAAVAYRGVLNNANGQVEHARVGGRTDYRWGHLNGQRERIAVNTIVRTTNEQIGFQPQPDGQPLEVHSFMNLSRRGGIESRFQAAGIPYRVHAMGSDGHFYEVPPTTAETDDVYQFATDYFWFETNQGASAEGMQYETMATAVREIPLEAIARVYEAHRARMGQIPAGNQSSAAAFRQAAQQVGRELLLAWKTTPAGQRLIARYQAAEKQQPLQ